MKDTRKDRASKLLKKIKHSLQQNMFWFFPDVKKNPCQGQMVNSQKSRDRKQ